MRIFVTGGTGFIGSHFLNTAFESGVNVRALRRSGSSPRIPLISEPDWIEGEFSDAREDWFEGCDIFVHFGAAGVSPQKIDWITAHQVNVTNSLALLSCAFESGIKGVVSCGTCLEYGSSADKYERVPIDAPLHPIGAYAASKAAYCISSTAYAAEKNIFYTYLRPFHAFGEGQHESNFWPSLRKAALAGEDFPMTLGEQIRDFMPVEDVAACFLEEALRLSSCAQGAKSKNQNFIRVANVGTGRPQTLREFAQHWWDSWDAKGKLLCGAIPYRPNEVMRLIPEI
jgi:nucleoside-diphosphate-sugar epimerase